MPFVYFRLIELRSSVVHSIKVGFKRCLIRKILSKAPKNCYKIKHIDRVLDGLVFALLVVKILDYLSIETGMAIGSIFAVGSTGTLIISLGSQEIAKGIVNGVEMASLDRFYEVSSTLAFLTSLFEH